MPATYCGHWRDAIKIRGVEIGAISQRIGSNQSVAVTSQGIPG